jgi:hypothetical protein
MQGAIWDLAAYVAGGDYSADVAGHHDSAPWMCQITDMTGRHGQLDMACDHRFSTA